MPSPKLNHWQLLPSHLLYDCKAGILDVDVVYPPAPPAQSLYRVSSAKKEMPSIEAEPNISPLQKLIYLIGRLYAGSHMVVKGRLEPSLPAALCNFRHTLGD